MHPSEWRVGDIIEALGTDLNPKGFKTAITRVDKDPRFRIWCVDDDGGDSHMPVHHAEEHYRFVSRPSHHTPDLDAIRAKAGSRVEEVDNMPDDATHFHPDTNDCFFHWVKFEERDGRLIPMAFTRKPRNWYEADYQEHLCIPGTNISRDILPIYPDSIPLPVEEAVKSPEDNENSWL